MIIVKDPNIFLYCEIWNLAAQIFVNFLIISIHNCIIIALLQIKDYTSIYELLNVCR